MPTSIAGNPNRQAHGVSLAFAGGIVVLVVLILVAFYFSRGSEPPPTYKAEELSTNGVNPNWYKRSFPTPAPAASLPMVVPTPAFAPRVMTPQPLYRPAPAQTPNLGAQERMRALLRAMSSGLDVKVAGSNVLETAPKDSQQVAVNTRPAPPHTLPAWSFIYASLVTPIDSDHSGDVLAKVTHAARDITQTEVLIPIGAVVHGAQKGTNRGNINDQSLAVVWDDVEFPDGSHLPVPKMEGMDETGAPGLSGEIDHHFAELWGPALLTSAIGAGVMLGQNPSYGSFSGFNSMQQASGSFTNNLGGFANRGLEQQLNSIRPTVKIPAGTPIRILVNRNFVFTQGAYQG